MVHLLPTLRADSALLRQDVGASRHRRSEVISMSRISFFCLTRGPSTSLLCNRFNIYCSYQQFPAGYYKNFADLCVEHHLLRLRNRLVVEAIGIVFFHVCFYRFCLGIMPQTTDLLVHFVL